MSFFEDNKYYIQQNLYSGMTNLSVEEKLKKYELVRTEMRERISRAYPKNKSYLGEVTNEELNSFYIELFEVIGLFELEYIMANLLFEPNFTNIIYYLKNNSTVFNNHITPPLKEYTFKWLFYFYLEENDFFQSVFLKFLKKIISEHTSLSVKHFEVQTKPNFSNPIFEFVHEYPNWLVNNLTSYSKLEVTVFIHLLVVKLLNLKPTFIEHEKGSSFSILFIHELSKAYNLKVKGGEKPKLHSFYTNTNKLIDSLFIKNFIVKTPILDDEKRLNYSNGFYIKRKELLKKVEEAEVLNNDLKNESYSTLFKILIESNSVIQEKIKIDILNKIKFFEIPNEKDINYLNNISLTNEVSYFKKWFLSKFYRFEIL